MQKRVERALVDADAALFVLPADQQVGPGDRFIADAIRNVPAFSAADAVNKLDLFDRPRTVEALSAAAELGVDGEVFSIKAGAATACPSLPSTSCHPAPGAVPLPARRATDLPERVRPGRLAREQALLRTREEVPHAVEVEVDESRSATTARSWCRPASGQRPSRRRGS